MLHPGEFVVKDGVADLIFLAVLANLFEFSASDVGCIVGTVYPLDELAVAFHSCRKCQKLKFFQIFEDFPFLLAVADYSYEDCLVRLCDFHFVSIKKAGIAPALINVVLSNGAGR